MAFRITITDDAKSQLKALPMHERRALEAAILAKLQDRPTTPTRGIKLYNVEASEVVLLVVGRKEGNKLIVGGIEFHAHQDDPPKPTGSGPARNAQ